MTSINMFIPKTITVGYNARNDTYTGKLAYIIYTDDKGKLRKEKSWKSWRQENLGRDDFDNLPTSGFVLNKGVGGARMSYGYNARNEYIRVYDPRNFEFEISVHNLLFILQECSAIKGKGLEGEFVYSWDGTTLVLLPVDCKEYEECIKHTERQAIKFDKKDIKEGHSYIMKDGTNVMYLGRHNFNSDVAKFFPVGKKHIFLNLNEEYYIPESGFTKIAECTSSTALTQFADEYDKFKKSSYSGDIKELKIKEETTVSNDLIYRNLLIKDKNDKYFAARLNYKYNYYYNNDRVKYLISTSKHSFVPELKNGRVNLPDIDHETNRPLSVAQTIYTLEVITEKGKKLKV